MPIFIYEAVNNEGKKVNGQIEADGLSEAVVKTRKLGIYPINVSEEKLGKASMPNFKNLTNVFSQASAMSIKQLALFTRELAVLLKSGIPLVKSLTILSQQSQFASRKDMIASLAKGIEEGATFSEALSANKTDFSSVYINMIKAGETSGALETILERLAVFLEKNIWLTNRIRVALIYPALVMTLACGIVIFLITFVVPKFVVLFQNMGTSLPMVTRLLIDFSQFLRMRWYVVLAIIFGLGYLLILMQKSAKYRQYLDRFKLNMPIVGPLVKKVSVSRVSRTLATLLNGGVPILQALLITKDICGNIIISQAIDKAHDSIKEGETISKPLGYTGVFPSLAINMIKVGEESGNLDAMLERVADAYDNEVDNTVTALTSILEPLLVIIMGVVVLIIVMALFLPLVSLIRALSV